MHFFEAYPSFNFLCCFASNCNWLAGFFSPYLSDSSASSTHTQHTQHTRWSNAIQHTVCSTLYSTLMTKRVKAEATHSLTRLCKYSLLYLYLVCCVVSFFAVFSLFYYHCFIISLVIAVFSSSSSSSSSLTVFVPYTSLCSFFSDSSFSWVPPHLYQSQVVTLMHHIKFIFKLILVHILLLLLLLLIHLIHIPLPLPLPLLLALMISLTLPLYQLSIVIRKISFHGEYHMMYALLHL